jgi:hypothetical protein
MTTVRSGLLSVFLRIVGGVGTMADGRIVSRVFASQILEKTGGCTRELVMGEAKRRRLACEQAGREWPERPRPAKERPDREVAYRYDPVAGGYRLVEPDGKLGPLLDMDADELEGQMQAEFERQESDCRGRQVWQGSRAEGVTRGIRRLAETGCWCAFSGLDTGQTKTLTSARF